MTLIDFIEFSLSSTTITEVFELTISDGACAAIKKNTNL